MKKNLFGIIMIIVAMGITIACERDTDKIQLRLRLEKGMIFKIQIVSDQIISQTIHGQQQEVNKSMGIGYIYNVEEMDDNEVASVKVTYHSVFFNQAGTGDDFEYDSSNPPEVMPPMAMGFAALVGNSFYIKISPEGHVNDVWGVDAMLTQMIKKLDLPDGPVKVAMEKSFRDQFSNQGLKEIMENMMALYPEKPVGIGDSWMKQIVVSRGFPMILDNTWTLKARKDGIATIEVCSMGKPNPEASPLEMGSMKLTYDVSGKQEGTMELEETTGWLVRGRLTQQLFGRVMVGRTPQMPKGMSWPISVESIISIERF